MLVKCWLGELRICRHKASPNNHLKDTMHKDLAPLSRCFKRVLLTAFALSSALSQALTFNVNSTADTSDAVLGNGTCATAANVCTLRAAIEESNALASGPHTINVPAGTYIVAQLDIVKPVTIVGAGMFTTIISGNDANRVFYIRTNTLTATNFSDLTVTRGLAPSGAGLLINGADLLTGTFRAMPVSLTRTRILANNATNVAPFQGGGINVYNGARLILNDSTVNSNSAPNGGGGLFLTAATAEISNSTIALNSISAGAGGAGIGATVSSFVTLLQSTVSGNSVGGVGGTGGGLMINASSLSMDQSTIADNSGVEQIKFVSPFSTTLMRSIIALPNGTAVNCTGVLASHIFGNNLEDGNTCNFPASANFKNTPALISGLANNGGDHLTHALQAGSLAINGSTLVNQMATDQRGAGFPRVVSALADIGALESATNATTSPLQTSLTGTGSGSVSGTGITCGSDCSEALTTGNSITLTATPVMGSVFAGWSGACTGTGACVVSVTGARFVQAQFDLLATLTTNKIGAGTGTITGSGINCGVDCTESMGSGTSVTLTATPDAGMLFGGWSGACSGMGTCTVTVNGNTTVTAQFVVGVTINVTKSGTGTGTVTGTGYNCGADCTEVLFDDSTLTLTATAAPGSVFIGWSGAGCSGTGTCTINVVANVTANAQFDLAPTPQLTVSITGAGSGSITATGINCGLDCTELYALNTIVTLTATPAVGSTFLGWSGGGCSGTGTCSVTMGQSQSVSAQFGLAAPVQQGIAVSVPLGDTIWLLFMMLAIVGISVSVVRSKP
jgi:CSLREA domain-containing protein